MKTAAAAARLARRTETRLAALRAEIAAIDPTKPGAALMVACVEETIRTVAERAARQMAEVVS